MTASIPTPDKTWQFNVNQLVATSGVTLTDHRNLLFAIKSALLGFSSTPWTVTGSSDGSTAGMDAVDRWLATGNLVWHSTGNAHSWIVLKQTGLNSNFELLIDLNSSGGSNASYYMSVAWSTAGFSGGSATVAPTSTNTQYVIGAVPTSSSSTYWAWGVNATFSRVLHMMQSSDGQCTRVIVFMGSGTSGYSNYMLWMIERAKNPVSGWTVPVFVVVSNGDATFKSSFVWLSDVARASGKFGTSTMWMCFSGEGYTNVKIPEGSSQQRRNQIGLEIPLYPIHLVSDTPGCRGVHGTVYDAWWGVVRTDLAGGWDGTWPDDSTRKLWSCGNIVMPWVGLNTPPGPVPLVMAVT